MHYLIYHNSNNAHFINKEIMKYNKQLMNITKAVLLLVLTVLSAEFLFEEEAASFFLCQNQTRDSLTDDQQQQSKEFLQHNRSAESVLFRNTSRRKISGTCPPIYSKYTSAPEFFKQGVYVYNFVKHSLTEKHLNKPPPSCL